MGQRQRYRHRQTGRYIDRFNFYTVNKYAPLKQKIEKKWADKQWCVITKSNEDFNEYKMQRNKVVNMIRQQKHIYYNTEINLNKNNPT